MVFPVVGRQVAVSGTLAFPAILGWVGISKCLYGWGGLHGQIGLYSSPYVFPIEILKGAVVIFLVASELALKGLVAGDGGLGGNSLDAAVPVVVLLGVHFDGFIEGVCCFVEGLAYVDFGLGGIEVGL